MTFKANFVSLRGRCVIEATVTRMALDAAKQKKSPKFHRVSSELESSHSATPFPDHLFVEFKLCRTRSVAVAWQLTEVFCNVARGRRRDCGPQWCEHTGTGAWEREGTAPRTTPALLNKSLTLSLLERCIIASWVSAFRKTTGSLMGKSLHVFWAYH